MKIFTNINLKKHKTAGLIIFGLLLLWFTFVLTGLKFGDTILVKSCFVDEPIDFLFWGIYVVCFIVFLLNDKIGKYIITGYIFLWGIMQATIYFRDADGIKSYNESFNQTHHLFKISDTFVVKDTYHFVLDILILSAFCYGVIYIILSILNKHKLNYKDGQK